MRKLIAILMGLSPFAVLVVVAAIAALSAASPETRAYLTAPISIANLKQ